MSLCGLVDFAFVIQNSRYDINTAGALCIEDVRCPLRGECLMEGVICKPRLQTELTNREREVALLLGQGLTNS